MERRSQTHLRAPKFDFTGMPTEKKITLLTGNSRTFNFGPGPESIDLIFVDGGHDLPTVTDDTANSLRSHNRTSRLCIQWHHDGNKYYATADAISE